jgi:hypothetical protein
MLSAIEAAKRTGSWFYRHTSTSERMAQRQTAHHKADVAAVPARLERADVCAVCHQQQSVTARIPQSIDSGLPISLSLSLSLSRTEQHASAAGVVEALDQRHHGRLAATGRACPMSDARRRGRERERRTDNSVDLAGFQLQIKICTHSEQAQRSTPHRRRPRTMEHLGVGARRVRKPVPTARQQ